MKKNVNILVSHVNVHQRVTTAEEYFNNQMDRVTCSVDNSQPLFPITPSSPNGLINKVATVAGIEVMQRLSNMDFCSSTLTWLQLPLSVQYASNRDLH